MEPLSAVASVLAVAEAGTRVSLAIFQALDSWKAAPKEIKSIGTDIALTSPIIEHLSATLIKATSSDTVSASAIKNGLRIANECKSLFQEMETVLEIDKGSQGRLSSNVERLKWIVSTKNLVTGWQERIAALKASMTMQLCVMNLDEKIDPTRIRTGPDDALSSADVKILKAIVEARKRTKADIEQSLARSRKEAPVERVPMPMSRRQFISQSSSSSKSSKGTEQPDEVLRTTISPEPGHVDTRNNDGLPSQKSSRQLSLFFKNLLNRKRAASAVSPPIEEKEIKSPASNVKRLSQTTENDQLSHGPADTNSFQHEPDQKVTCTRLHCSIASDGAQDYVWTINDALEHAIRKVDTAQWERARIVSNQRGVQEDSDALKVYQTKLKLVSDLRVRFNKLGVPVHRQQNILKHIRGDCKCTDINPKRCMLRLKGPLSEQSSIRACMELPEDSQAKPLTSHRWLPDILDDVLWEHTRLALLPIGSSHDGLTSSSSFLHENRAFSERRKLSSRQRKRRSWHLPVDQNVLMESPMGPESAMNLSSRTYGYNTIYSPRFDIFQQSSLMGPESAVKSDFEDWAKFDSRDWAEQRAAEILEEYS